MWYGRPAKAQTSLRVYMQSDQSICWSLEYFMTVKLQTEHHLEFLSLKGDCTGSSESTLVKMPHWWQLRVEAHKSFFLHIYLFVAVFLRYNQHRPGGFMVLCFFYVQEHLKAQPAVALVLKRFRRRDHGLKSQLTDWDRTCDPWFTRHRFIPYTTAAPCIFMCTRLLTTVMSILSLVSMYWPF